MKKIIKTTFFVLGTLLITTSAFASGYTSGSDFNSINMSYTANSYIKQTIVFDSNIQSAVSLDFSVQARNGGGRPTVDPDNLGITVYPTNTDKATLTIKFYDINNTLISTQASQQFELQNYGSAANNPGWSEGPGDNIYDWENLSLSVNSSTVDFSTVAYAEVEMKATDGSFWAGNYGAQWRAPTVTYNDGTTDSQNILYNPEFGLSSDSTVAQGWTSNLSYTTNCGTISGNLHCVTDGGVTANESNGTEDPNGGTLSATPGGYPSTFTLATFSGSDGDGTVSDTSVVQAPVYVSLNSTITVVYPTSTNTPPGEEATKAVDGSGSTKYLNFDRETAGFTVKLSTGRVVKALQFTTANDYELRDPTKFTLYGSNDGVTWTVIAQDQPVTLPSGRGVTIDPVTITNTTAYVYYFITFPELKSTTDPSCANPTTQNQILACDSVQIAEVIFLMEDGDTTTSSDAGSGSVSNPGPQVQVPLTSITSVQQAQVATAFAITSGNNIDFTIIGSSNTVDIEQLSNGNYLLLYLNGSSNALDITQSGSNADRNFADINIVGNSNTMTFEQSGNSNKTAFLDIDGSFGTYNITQTGTGQHHLDLTNLGNDATVTVLQEGAGNHQAIVALENAGGNWNFNLTQSGDTNQLYSIPNNLSDNTVVSGSCTSGTCNMTINQQ